MKRLFLAPVAAGRRRLHPRAPPRPTKLRRRRRGDAARCRRRSACSKHRPARPTTNPRASWCACCSRMTAPAGSPSTRIAPTKPASRSAPRHLPLGTTWTIVHMPGRGRHRRQRLRRASMGRSMPMSERRMSAARRDVPTVGAPAGIRSIATPDSIARSSPFRAHDLRPRRLEGSAARVGRPCLAARRLPRLSSPTCPTAPTTAARTRSQ